MKKILITFMAIFAMVNLYAQNVTDAVRIANDEISGTARFKAMGEAFGALGGDLSAVNINPASSSVFNSSKASFTAGFSGNSNTTSYFGNALDSDENQVNFSQGGGVFVYESNSPNSKWNKFALGVAYDRTGNFDENFTARGISPNTSIAEYFLDFAQGLRLDEISALPGESLNEAYSDIGSVFGYANQQAFLGYESFIIEPLNDTDDNTQYESNIIGGNYNQTYTLQSTGYNGKMAFNFSGEYDNRLNVGFNINAHFLNYERITVFDESNSNAGSTVTAVGFDNTLRTTGAGVSFQFGGIYKLTNEFRVGFTYDTPTWYRITDETTQYLQTTVDGFNEPIIINPNVINIFPEYRLRTPGKITGSLAYVFSDKGLFSFDYSRKDFSQTTFKPSGDPFFAFQNNEISNLLGVSNTYRIGGEYRYNKLSFRVGYRFQESPYKNENIMGDLTGYSLGLGYKVGSFSVDAAFSQSQREQSNLLYSEAPSFTSAQVDSKFTDFVVTFTFGI
ncbi:OmpP1/FadL family transporter [Winogradskyella litorisediminis]|uniref:OmpP1/FadL family transporter n=1 Tax=Winogradskyella litorisediminis TaxID=1156618 RepID=A0ABW3NAD1_9FLAO